MKAVAVVIPARDEEATLPATLAAVRSAARAVDCPVITVVACDSCTDGTVAVATEAGAHVVETAAGCAGGARRVGVAAAATLLAGVDPTALWVASTDADSVVRVDWLSTHLAAADAGWHAYAGEVFVPDWSGWSEQVSTRHERRYRRPGRRPPVHGANLGVRLDAYRAVGGYQVVAHGEDQLLVECLQRAALSVMSSGAAPVHTSARRVARANGGFSCYLSELESEG